MNFFVCPDGGQAFLTMPLMVPLGDILGVSRQAAVQTFLYGNCFAIMIVPTNPLLIGIPGMAVSHSTDGSVFCLPLLLKLLALTAIGMVMIGFSWSQKF